MRSGHTAGAALDVYPSEPAANGDYFNASLNTWGNDLRSLKNLILTPHIGGSTEEAQSAIGVEVGDALVRYINDGSTIGAVNMPEVTLRGLTLAEENHVRVIFIHSNRPGVLRQVNSILGDHNVDKQMSDSRGDVAYLMADISDVNAGDIKSLYESLESLSCKYTNNPQLLYLPLTFIFSKNYDKSTLLSVSQDPIFFFLYRGLNFWVYLTSLLRNETLF